MKRREFLTRTSVAAAVALTGCGGSSADDSSPPAPAPAPSPSPAGPGSPSGQLPRISTLTVHSSQGGTFPYFAAVYPAQGAVPPGQILKSPDDSVLTSSVLSRWPDGSASVVVAAGETQVATNASKQIRLSAAPANGAPLAATRVGQLVSRIDIDCGAAGTGALSNFDSPARIWWQNERVICARYRLTIGGALDALIDVHAFASNRAFVEIVFENSAVSSATPVRPAAQSYSANVSVNGSLIATVSSSAGPQLVHEGFRAWYASTWVGGDPGIEVTHDAASLQAHPLLWRCDQVNTVNLQATYQNDAYTPWSTGRQRATAMGGGGDHPSIGPLTQWDARYVQSGDRYVRRAVISNALAVLAYNVNIRDTNTGGVPTYGQIDGKTIGTGWPSNSNEPAWEVAHHPAEGLLAFLCRPSPCFIEIAQKITVWNATWSGSDNGPHAGLKNIFGHWYQTRGKAWCIRSLAHSIFLTPDGDPWKSDAQAALYRNAQLLDAFRTDTKAVLNFVWDFSPSSVFDMESGMTGFQNAMWEHHYLVTELHKAANANLLTGSQQDLLKTVSDWAALQPVRFVNEAAAGEWRAIAYKTTVGRAGTTIDSMPTWASQMQNAYSDLPPALSGPWLSNGGTPTTYASFSPNTVAGAYYPSYFWAALVAAVERAVPGADAAWSKVRGNVTNLDTWRGGFATDPRWGSYPRNQ